MNLWTVLPNVLGTVSLIIASIAAIRGHRVQNKAVEVDRFEAANKAQDARIADLEGAFKSEREAHSETRHLFAVALQHLRAVVVWSTTDRSMPIPPPPPELAVHL